MINIDKSTSLGVTASVTISEKRVIGYTIYLDLFNFYTNRLYTYQNLNITFDERLDTVGFDLNQEQNNEMVEAGLYEYNFYQVIGGVKRSCEKGLCKIVGDTDITWQITPDETEDDYITYNG